jgi:hypothetical protein
MPEARQFTAKVRFDMSGLIETLKVARKATVRELVLRSLRDMVKVKVVGADKS